MRKTKKTDNTIEIESEVKLEELQYPKQSEKIFDQLKKYKNFFIYGEENFLIDDLTSEIILKLKKNLLIDFANVVIQRINFLDSNLNFEAIIANLESENLFNDEFNIIVLQHLNELLVSSTTFKNVCKLLGLINKNNNSEVSNIIIIPYNNKKIPSELQKNIKNFLIINCKKMYESDIFHFVHKLAARTQKSFTDDAINEIIELSQYNLYQINSELKRLSVLYYEEAEIDLEMVQNVVEPFFDNSFTIYSKLDEAIFKKDLKNSIKIINEMLEHDVYHGIIVNRLISNWRLMLSILFLNEINTNFKSGAYKIAEEYIKNISYKKGYEKFRFTNEILEKFDFFCKNSFKNEILKTNSKYDCLNLTKNITMLYAVYYLKNYTEKTLFNLIKDFYQIDVKIRTGLLRIDQRPELIKEEIFKILIINFKN